MKTFYHKGHEALEEKALSHIPAERFCPMAKAKARKPRGVRRIPVCLSEEQRFATPPTYYRAIAQNTQDQGVQAWRREAYISSIGRDGTRCTTMRFFTSAIRERLRQGAKVKPHKLGGVRRTSVRRSNEQRRATPRLALSQNRSGFSYLGVLILVAVMSISLVGTGRYWSTIVKRELEAELLYRGDRIREAIASYYNNPPGGQNKTYPRQFSDLLKDPRYPDVKRHLRKWYTDPMNRGKDWVYILDASQRLKGVHSAHEGTPLKTGNFPKDYREFEQAQTYADWTFVFVPKQ
jgi:type II secretory pathway pseudopilin PulG